MATRSLRLRRCLRALAVAHLVSVIVGAGPAAAVPAALPPARVLTAPTTSFDPGSDAFAFGNGLRWDYETDFVIPESAPPRPPRGDYDQRCSQMSRATRQFFRHARFAPEEPRLPEGRLRERIRAVMQRDPRLREASPNPIVIPGFAHLHALSRAHEELLKAAIGERWRAYFQRGNWRMIFGFSDRHQRRTAEQMLASLERDQLPIVHLIRFPRITINHTMLIHRAIATAEAVEFVAYDPNHPGIEIALRYDRARASFELQPTFYWPGGRVITYEVFRDRFH